MPIPSTPNIGGSNNLDFDKRPRKPSKFLGRKKDQGNVVEWMKQKQPNLGTKEAQDPMCQIAPVPGMAQDGAAPCHTQAAAMGNTQQNNQALAQQVQQVNAPAMAQKQKLRNIAAQPGLAALGQAAPQPSGISGSFNPIKGGMQGPTDGAVKLADMAETWNKMDPTAQSGVGGAILGGGVGLAGALGKHLFSKSNEDDEDENGSLFGDAVKYTGLGAVGGGLLGAGASEGMRSYMQSQTDPNQSEGWGKWARGLVAPYTGGGADRATQFDKLNDYLMSNYKIKAPHVWARALLNQLGMPKASEDSYLAKFASNGPGVPVRLLTRLVPMADRRDDLTPDEDKEVEEGQEQWIPPIVQTDATPIAQLQASPAKQGILAALLAGGAGAAVGGLAGKQLGGTPGAIAGAAGLGGLSAGAAGIWRALHQYAQNQHYQEIMRRFPEGATRRDYNAQEMLTGLI